MGFTVVRSPVFGLFCLSPVYPSESKGTYSDATFTSVTPGHSKSVLSVQVPLSSCYSFELSGQYPDYKPDDEASI